MGCVYTIERRTWGGGGGGGGSQISKSREGIAVRVERHVQMVPK